MPRLVVIPNDPLQAYLAKGEVKEGYFNPGDVFDRVEVISLTDHEADPAQVRAMAGRAELAIHCLGRPKPWAMGPHLRRVTEAVAALKPDLIRGYNPLYMGRLAVAAGRATGRPAVISVHDDFSLRRSLSLYGWRYLASARGGYQLIHQPLWARAMFRSAAVVICAYPFAARWVNSFSPRRVEIILNRVYTDRFHPPDAYDSAGPLRILNLGRQFEGKNPTNIIRALAGLDDARLTLVGQGPLHDRLRETADRAGLADRVEFIPAVANDRLPQLMAEHDVFAMNLIQPGVCIPILEAMAAGLPVVVNRPRFRDGLDLVGQAVLQVEDSPEGYGRALVELAEDDALRERLGRAGVELVRGIDGRVMERREADLYRELLGG